VGVFQPGIEKVSEKNDLSQVIHFSGEAIVQFIDHRGIVLRFASDMKIREDEYQIDYRLNEEEVDRRRGGKYVTDVARDGIRFRGGELVVRSSVASTGTVMIGFTGYL